jgi:hypothetical protein
LANARDAARSSGDPWTRDEIVDALGRIHEESVAYWQRFTADAFLAPLGSAWSPADNVRHLTKSIRPVAQALRIPWLLLRLRFGAPRPPSRSYSAVRQAYLQRLAEGVQAGRFAPKPLDPPSDPELARHHILGEHAAAVAALASSISSWRDASLDRCRLPHPALGMLTVREMLFFTLYHNQHHVEVVRRRTRAADV